MGMGATAKAVRDDGPAGRLFLDLAKALDVLATRARATRKLAGVVEFVSQDVASAYADWARAELFNVLDARQVVDGWLRERPGERTFLLLLRVMALVEPDLYGIVRLCRWLGDKDRKMPFHVFEPLTGVGALLEALEAQEMVDRMEMHRLSALLAGPEARVSRWTLQDADEAWRMRKADLAFWRAQAARWRKAATTSYQLNHVARVEAAIAKIAANQRVMGRLLKEAWPRFPLTPRQQAEVVARVGRVEVKF